MSMLESGLFHKVQRLAGIDPSGANQLLHVILESSDVSEVLLMRCFDQVLQQRIMETRGLRIVTDNEHARFVVPKSISREEGSVSALSHDLRAQSEAGSARLHTPTPEIEDIVRDLLCGRMQEADAGFRTQCDSNTQISRGGAPLLPLREKTNEVTPAEVSMTMSALKTLERLSDERNKAKKVKFTTLKNAGTGTGES